MIAASDFLRDWLWLVALLITIAVVIFIRALKNPKFRMRVHMRLAKMPIMGTLVCTSDSTRLASTLGILARSGVPLVEAMAISSQVITNLAIREAVLEATRRVRECGSISHALGKSDYLQALLMLLHIRCDRSGDVVCNHT